MGNRYIGVNTKDPVTGEDIELTRDVEKASMDRVRDSVLTPDTARDHESLDVLMVFRTAELRRPTRKAMLTIATATGSSSVIDRQQDTAAALSAPVQKPERTASKEGKEVRCVSTLLNKYQPNRS